MSEQKEITIRFRINACSESEISGGKGFVKTTVNISSERQCSCLPSVCDMDCQGLGTCFGDMGLVTSVGNVGW